MMNLYGALYWVTTWGISLLIAAPIALAANRWFRLPLVWVFVLGAVIFGVLIYPIHTGTALVEMPRKSN
jgi:hypothetical protein